MAAPTNAAARLLGMNELTIEALMAFLTGLNNDGTTFGLPVTATVTATTPKAATATLSNVDVSDGANHVLLALNANRLGASFYNDSTANLFLKFGTTASSTSYTIKLAPGGYYELAGVTVTYTGVVSGIEDAANGAVRVTELTT